MDAEPDAETSGCCPSSMFGCEDSEEETSQEVMPITSWNELSIIDRVGLNSVEMSEKELETAFSQIALAFRCDQYTLKQRLQAEEHARNLAEENIQLELTRGRETLETLKSLCLDSARSDILQRLELSLDILSGTVERISNTAEVLGAVHQEARVSRAVELMVAHVENLKRRHDRKVADLEEAKNLVDSGASPDPEESDHRKKSFQQNNNRQRVSVSLIPSQAQKIKRDLRKKSERTCRSPSHSSGSSCSALAKDDGHSADDRPLDPDEAPPEAPAAQLPLRPSPERPPSTQPATRTTRSTSSPLDALRQRHKSKSALSKKKADREKTKNISRPLSVDADGSFWRHRPPAHWLSHCRWALLCTYLLVLVCVMTLTYFLLEAS